MRYDADLEKVYEVTTQAIKKAYDENGIEIPFPIRTVEVDGKSAPMKLECSGED